MRTLDQISRWETFRGLPKYLDFINELWFLPITVIVGLLFIFEASKREVADAIEEARNTHSLFSPDGSLHKPRIKPLYFWVVPTVCAGLSVLPPSSAGAYSFGDTSPLYWLWRQCHPQFPPSPTSPTQFCILFRLPRMLVLTMGR